MTPALVLLVEPEEVRAVAEWQHLSGGLRVRDALRDPTLLCRIADLIADVLEQLDAEAADIAPADVLPNRGDSR